MIGFAKVISINSSSEHVVLSEWFSFLKERFSLFHTDNEILGIDEKGDVGVISREQAEDLFRKNKSITIRIRNSQNNFITSILVLSSDKCYSAEEYSMDELLCQNEYDELFEILHARYLELTRRDTAIALIFDKRGYSEDYFSFQLFEDS